jgi:hypothetical protein
MITEGEYLRIERAATVKAEFAGGEMFSMPGGTSKNALLGTKAIIELGIQLNGRRCRVVHPDLRLRTPRSCVVRFNTTGTQRIR